MDNKSVKKYAPGKLAKRKYSCSTFMIYLGVKKKYDFPYHNVFFAEEFIDPFETSWFKNLDADMHPGDSVRIYRENAGFTQDELGEKLGKVPRQNISAMEKGRQGISKVMAKKLSRILHAPIERFL